VAIVAPSGPFPADAYERGLSVLRARGHEPVELLAGEVHRYLAGSDEERLRSLRRAYSHPGVRVLLAARGGYGAMRLLPALDLDAMAASPRVLVGFSDVTALHLALLARGGRGLVHGPMITQLGRLPAADVDRLFTLLETGAPPPPLRGRAVVPGIARGPLVGGNLTVLASLVGTPYLPDLRGCVLLLEEVFEQPYRIDRMWTHLRLAGLLDGVAGVAFGSLVSCATPGATYTAQEVVDDLLRELGKPAVAELPVGHGDENAAVPLGARVVLQDGVLTFEEGASC
jgi:muramoyltetrapeptide carboxypeptidase